MRFDIIQIWRRLDLPGPELAHDLAEALEAASKPGKTLLDCPWNHCGRDRYFRARRMAWRVAFRLQRDRYAVGPYPQTYGKFTALCGVLDKG